MIPSTELEDWASEYEGACTSTDPNTPGGGRADDFEWHEDEKFPLAHLGTASDWTAWWEEEKRMWRAEQGDGEDGTGNRMDHFEKYWRAEPMDPIIVVLDRDGKYYLWDGNHRTGLSVAMGRTTIHAIVGIRKPGIQVKRRRA